MNKLLDKYIKHPLLYDLIIVSLFILGKHILSSKNIISITIPIDTLKSIVSDIISTTISLAGFILASLTIIVTFKDNINHKEIYNKIEAKNELTGMELLFTSKHYKRIVGVFSWSCIIFLTIFFLTSIVKLFLDRIDKDHIFDIIILSFITLSATIFRCLLILHKIIKIQISSNSDT